MSKITEIVLASRNPKKLAELASVLAPLGITLHSVLDYPEAPEVEETGDTFMENAALKAESVAAALNLPVLADDSGLVVDYLGGEPGVYSARYAGAGATDASNNQLLLQRLQGVPAAKRGARFVCVLAFSCGGNGSAFFEGETRGMILEEPAGEGGFGYDPIFYSVELELSFAQAGSQAKNEISHRGRAVAKFIDWLRKQ